MAVENLYHIIPTPSHLVTDISGLTSGSSCDFSASWKYKWFSVVSWHLGNYIVRLWILPNLYLQVVLLMRVSTQVMAYIYGHGSNHSLIFRAFVVLFQLTWIMWLLQPPLVPADASFRDREDRLEVLVLLLCRKERASQATCFGGILLAVAVCCLWGEGGLSVPWR